MNSVLDNQLELRPVTFIVTRESATIRLEEQRSYIASILHSTRTKDRKMLLCSSAIEVMGRLAAYPFDIAWPFIVAVNITVAVTEMHVYFAKPIPKTIQP